MRVNSLRNAEIEYKHLGDIAQVEIEADDFSHKSRFLIFSIIIS